MPKKLDMNVLIEIAANKTSITKLALAAFDYAFEDEIKAGFFNDGSYNFYGRSMNNSKDVKIELDAVRVKALEDFGQVTRYMA